MTRKISFLFFWPSPSEYSMSAYPTLAYIVSQEIILFFCPLQYFSSQNNFLRMCVCVWVSKMIGWKRNIHKLKSGHIIPEMPRPDNKNEINDSHENKKKKLHLIYSNIRLIILFNFYYLIFAEQE